MMKENTEFHNLGVFLTIVADFTVNESLLHRAKALKWTGEKNGSEKGLSNNEKDKIWKTVLEYDLVSCDERGNIIKLTNAGYEHLLNFTNRKMDNGQ